MTAWLIGIVTLVLLVFIIWRRSSKTFRERAENPKFRFLENLGLPSSKANGRPTSTSEENNHEKRDS